MNKKNFIQLFLIFFISLISFFLYLEYFSDTKQDDKNSNSLKPKSQVAPSEETGNLITELRYNSFNAFGNNYEIVAEYGKIDPTNPEIILMKNVSGIITDAKQNIIKIVSLSAKYNTSNRETNFFDNVLLTFADNRIKSENLDLFFEKNLVYMSKKIVYKNSNIELKADKIEMEILSKNIKIYMDNKYQRIEINGTY
jgi:hypothetical protein